MSKMKTKRRERGGKFVKLDEWLMKTEAWRSLDPVARCIFIEMARLYNGHNNGEIGMACRRAAERVGVKKTIAAERIQTLMDRGFIRLTRAAEIGLRKRRQRFSASYPLTHVPVGKALPTKEFVHWRAGVATSTLKCRAHANTGSLRPPQREPKKVVRGDGHKRLSARADTRSCERFCTAGRTQFCQNTSAGTDTYTPSTIG